jgi:hypothetical protein
MTDVWLAGEYAVRGQWNAAHQVLNNIPNEYSLTINQVSEYQNIVTIFNAIANEDINNLSSPAINALISIRNLDNGNAQLLASNILRLNWEDSSPKYYMPNIGIIRPRNSLSNEILVTTIYPNPVSNKLIVIWEKDNVSSVNFQIHSLNNDSVLSGLLKKGEDIDVSNFSNGLYFLSLDFGNGEMSTHKVLIVK